MHGKKRNVESSIDYLLKKFPSVVLLGARQVGKSTLMQRLFPEHHHYDMERDVDFLRIMNDPELFFEDALPPFIIDEAQRAQTLFNAIKVNIDRNRQDYGRFLLTGSSSPDLLQSITESLAGRCALVNVNGFCFNEPYEKPKSSFYSKLGQPLEAFMGIKPCLELKELMELCLYGSYPEPFLRRSDRIYGNQWMASYIKSYVERDIQALFPMLNLDAFKRFFKMVSFANGEIINYANFARSLDVSQPTIKKYFEILEGTFIWRSIPSFAENLKKRTIKMPKGYIRDTGLVNFFLNIHTTDDLFSHPLFGRIWESFISEQIIRALQEDLKVFQYYHYRSSNQAEIDLILEGEFGLIPIEIKSGKTTDKRRLRVLEDFVHEFKCPYGIVINQGDDVFKLSHRLIQIPARFL